MIKSFFLLLALAAPFIAAQAQDADAGEKKIAMCIGCHGIVRYQASFPEVHKVPMIAGQNAKFIVASLMAYQKGERKHPTMRSIAASMTEQDMADVAAFYERQGRVESSVKSVAAYSPSAAVDALLSKGGCVACHGADFNQPIDPSYPKVAGQYADYLYVSLKSYQTEGNPQIGRSNAIMGGIAKQFTLAELKQLSRYLATLPGELKTVPEPKFR